MSPANLAVIGVDPGPTSGIVGLAWCEGRLTKSVIQCNADSVLMVLRALTDSRTMWRANGGLVYVGLENFVDGSHHDRKLHGAAAVTRELINSIVDYIPDMRVRVVRFNAAAHKPWARAADHARLRRSGLWAATDGMRHARDGAKIALYTAVAHCNVDDPITGRWGA